ncbi:uncharacterized protein LOC115726294 isoform X2 [Rhodamnia argentea]|uniref:PRA1 family protein n=1 Tax=Rhodamnia argentea TaxID=178133 RepID=A0ABM3H825_9MYRT|nr:uncharacterized protein LOC115726294 isoform X2 [Rhodamnia argentea]
MSNFGITQRPSSISPSTPQMETPHAPKARPLNNVKLAFPFGLPATPEAAAARIIKNLSHFSLFYALFLWVGLSISLVPQRRYSLLLLMATTIIANQYLIMLRLMPSSICMNKALDKTLVLVPVAIVTAVGLILTQAAIHLFATLGIGLPVILVHAVLWREGGFVNEEASAPGELAPLVDTVQSV